MRKYDLNVLIAIHLFLWIVTIISITIINLLSDPKELNILIDKTDKPETSIADQTFIYLVEWNVGLGGSDIIVAIYDSAEKAMLSINKSEGKYIYWQEIVDKSILYPAKTYWGSFIAEDLSKNIYRWKITGWKINDISNIQNYINKKVDPASHIDPREHDV